MGVSFSSNLLSFRPPLWARSAHLQTVVGPVTRKLFLRTKPVDRLFSIPSATDGSVLQGKLWLGSRRRDQLVIIFHGLAGHIDSFYMLGSGSYLNEVHGYSVLRIGMRGAEVEPPFTNTFYHAGLSEDFSAVLTFLKSEEAGRSLGVRKIFVLAYSLSANTLLKWLGEGSREITAAFAVNPPVNLATDADCIDRFRNRLYQRYFLVKLRKAILSKAAVFSDIFGKMTGRPVFETVHSFDDHVTSELFGFSGAEDYYEKASSYPYLPEIKNPVKVVHSIDDPFVGWQVLDEARRRVRPEVDIALLRGGGHMGYYAGPKKGYMVDHWAAEYFQGFE